MVNASIVTYHTPIDELRALLCTIELSSIHTLYVIDNSRQRYIEALSAEFPNTVYTPSENIGYGAAHNIAIRRSLENPAIKYHLVLNSDLSFSPSDIDSIKSFMDINLQVGTLQPRIIGMDGKHQYTCRMLPTPADLLLRRFLPRWLMKKSRRRYLLCHLDPEQPHNIPYHQGSFMFLRTDALRIAGLFDERFFMYPEDIDLTRRIHRTHETLYWPGVTITHAHRAGSYHSPRLLWIHITNMVRYFNKHGWWHDPERRRFNRPLRNKFTV